MGKAEASGLQIARQEYSSSYWHQRSSLPRPSSRGPSGDPQGPQLQRDDRKLMVKAGRLGR